MVRSRGETLDYRDLAKFLMCIDILISTTRWIPRLPAVNHIAKPMSAYQLVSVDRK